VRTAIQGKPIKAGVRRFCGLSIRLSSLTVSRDNGNEVLMLSRLSVDISASNSIAVIDVIHCRLPLYTPRSYTLASHSAS